MVEEKKLIITDADTIAEISTFIERKNSYSADEGYHDDLVMPLVLFSWLTTNSYFKELTNINIRKELYEARIKMIEEEVTPFGFINNGEEDKKIRGLSTPAVSLRKDVPPLSTRTKKISPQERNPALSSYTRARYRTRMRHTILSVFITLKHSTQPCGYRPHAGAAVRTKTALLNKHRTVRPHSG
jgi:hypothetical protein